MSAEESAERYYHLLSEALSENAPQRQRAEQQLRDGEQHADFFASMVAIATANDDDAEPRIRWLAAVCGKNAVTRSWRRRTSDSQITEDERSYVMQQLLSGIGEKHSTIASQISLWISLVARIDFPKQWPTLLTDLCNAVRAPEPTVMMHALSTLDMVVKQLASRRLISDRKALIRVTPHLFELFFQVFTVHLNILVQNQSPPDISARSFDAVVLCMKGFRRLLAYGCENLSDITSVSPMFSKLLQFPDVFMRGGKGGTESQARLSLLAAKLVRVTHERHPISFQPFLAAFLEMYYSDVVAFDSKLSLDRVCYQAAYFLRNAIRCPAYELQTCTMEQFQENLRKGVEPPQGISAEGCRWIVLSFFNESRSNALIEAIISKIFVLNETELDIWAHDPESLMREEEAAEWGTENLRHECEGLFNIMLIREKRRVVPLIIQLAESVSVDKPLLLDACYRAVGRVVDDVNGAFNFDSWLSGRLGVILRADCSSNMGERIVQARAAWLVGQFVGQYSRENHQAMYPILVRLMGFMDQDKFLALTAAKSIQNMVEDFEFHAIDFAPHIQPCVAACFRIVSVSETFETRRAVVTMLCSIVSRCPVQVIVPVMDLLTSCLPTLWEDGSAQVNVSAEVLTGASSEAEGNGISGQSGSQNMMRMAITTLLTLLVGKLGPAALQCESLRKLVYAVIGYTIDLSPGKGGAYMMEDGCELWTAVVKGSTEYNEGLDKLFPYTEKILGVDFDNLKEVCRVTEEYAILGKEVFMRQHGTALVESLGRTLDSVKDRGCLATVEIVDILLQLFPDEGVRFCTGILQFCLQKLLGGNESHVLSAAYAALLARALLSNVGAVESLVLQGNEEALLELVDATLDNLYLMYRLPRRKMAMLALAGVTGRHMGNNKIVEKVPRILSGFVQVLSQERAANERKGNGEWSQEFENAISRFGEDGDVGANAGGHLPGAQRRKALQERDVVAHMSLGEACSGLLGGIKAANAQNYERIVAATDSTTLNRLELLIQR